ncbi:hypothetical protein Y590_22965 [Methylobacterium sp. AMS5]|nr:hypothetical protein Y590_22965 [Methylobacterium sp. AMS5]
MPPVTTIGQATQPGAAEGLIVTSALRRFEPVMIDSIRLLPPGFGLSADPVLFGVSDALARLLPLPNDDFAALCQSGTGGGSAVLAPASAEPPSETDPTG